MTVLQQEQLTNLLKEYEEEMIQLRRYFHENPELSFEEVNTPKQLQHFIESWVMKCVKVLAVMVLSQSL